MNLRIISGGQTGVDRAALDVALELGIPCGGWCPRGRKAEDGRIPDRYPLTETESLAYTERTRRNVVEADATLIIVDRKPLTGGTRLTAELAGGMWKLWLVVDLANPEADGWPDTVRGWITLNKIRVLNVAGPRAGKCPGIHGRAVAFLRRLLAGFGEEGNR